MNCPSCDCEYFIEIVGDEDDFNRECQDCGTRYFVIEEGD